MPDFECKIRRSYQDVTGLVLDLRHDGFAADGSIWENTAPVQRVLMTGTHTGSTGATLFDIRRNFRTNQLVGRLLVNVTSGASGLVTANDDQSVTAALTGGTRTTWISGDAYALLTTRFGDATQTVEANRPTRVLYGDTDADHLCAAFSRSASQFMRITNSHARFASPLSSFAEIASADGSDNGQTILSGANFAVTRRNASGNGAYRHNATEQALSAEMDAGVWSVVPSSPSAAGVFKDGSTVLSGGSWSDAELEPEIIFLGSTDGSTGFLDAKLRHVAVWDRQLSPQETDFIHNSFSHLASHSTNPYLSVEMRKWTDNTRMYPRPEIAARTGRVPVPLSLLNSTPGNEPLFHLCTGSKYARLQIAAHVGGLVLPDSELGGRLFSWASVEFPGVRPNILRDTGWSSVADFRVFKTGHYTVRCLRPQGGGHILHFDVQLDDD